MLKKFPLDKTNGTKYVFFFSFASSNWSQFYFEFAILMWGETQMCVGFSIFDYVLFLLKIIFLFNKMHRLFDFKTS